MLDFLNSLWTDRARVTPRRSRRCGSIVALGFNWFGGYGFNWTLGGNAQKMASVAATDAMIPICADQFLALGPDAQAEYKATKVADHDDVIRKHLKTVGAVTVDFSFARACAAVIDSRAQLAGKAS